ncbi:MAG: hypothetical protein ACREQF_01580 [Candidatus Binataceae bacterium]
MSRVVLAIVRDLFFRSKIDAAASIIGADVAYASDLSAAAKRCGELAPRLVVIDLSDAAATVAKAAGEIRAAAPGARLIGFASHVDVKTLKAARDAGFDAALSKSEFTTQLPELLKSVSGDS